MYSKEFFLESFRKQDNDLLIDRLAAQELTDEAESALREVLAERGFGGQLLEQSVYQSKKDLHLRTGATNQCDYCGKALLPPAFAAENQKFCGIDCFHTSRLHHAAVDIDDGQARAHAAVLKAGACPICARHSQRPDMYSSHYIVSMLFVTSTSTERAFSCRSCAHRKVLWASLYCLTLGWWSLYGLLRTPFQILENGLELCKRRDAHEPSMELVEWARLALAEELLRQGAGGRWGLRA